MTGELFEIEGEKKKRVVCPDCFFFPFLLESRFSSTLPLHVQCYFFDSDVGGFHYGPGHPYAPVLYDGNSTLKKGLCFCGGSV
jgi:hypothetical protein